MKERKKKMIRRYCCVVASMTLLALYLDSIFLFEMKVKPSLVEEVVKKEDKSIIPRYAVTSECENLSNIRRSGTFFLDKKVRNCTSPIEIQPSFQFGSAFGHCNMAPALVHEIAHYKLINRTLGKNSSKSRKIAFDIGANQGFYTYFMGALGAEVHAFEIFKSNFVALHHGTHFNSKAINERVHVYPIGIGEKIDRFEISGKDYEGFLKPSDNGDILCISFDCLQYHIRLDLNEIAFMKVDVEGNEIAFLQGAEKTLFTKQDSAVVEAMLIEVGPARWTRASTEFSVGVRKMNDLLSFHFKKSFILIRTSGPYSSSCPSSLIDEKILDKNPENIAGVVKMYKITTEDEMKILLTKLYDNDWDCNFFFTN